MSSTSPRRPAPSRPSAAGGGRVTESERLNDICTALACGASGCPCGQTAVNGRGLTHCPAHDDRRPSLHVDKGRAAPVLRCHAGCSQADVLGALTKRGLSLKELLLRRCDGDARSRTPSR
jgi:hypothetical protein